MIQLNQTVMSTRTPHKIDSGEEILPFEMGDLPEFFQKKAEIELNESPENIERGLRLLREMALGDKNLDGLRFDDAVLIWFLRHRKYNVDNAFSRLKLMVLFIKNEPELFTNIKLESFLPGPRDNSVTFLPRRCPEGCAILRVEFDRWDTEEVPLEIVKQLVVSSIWHALREPMTQVNGFKVIINAKTSNPLRIIKFCTPSNIYQLYHGSQVCAPARFIQIHVVNSVIVKIAWTLAKPFLSSKLKKRFIFHSGTEALLNYFPRSVLPKDYGGDLEDNVVSKYMMEWYRRDIQPDLMLNIRDGSTTETWSTERIYE